MGSNIVDKFRLKIDMMKYKLKSKKLDISEEFIKYLIERKDVKYCEDILSIIDKSKDKVNFSKNVLKYIKENPNNFLNATLILGNFIGNYNYYGFNNYDIKINIDNFLIKNKEKVLEKLRDNFYYFVMNDNKIKNKMNKYNSEFKYTDLNGDLDKNDILQVFDDVLAGKDADDYMTFDRSKVVCMYIFTMINNYTKDDILNNFDFINYDLVSNSKENLDKKRENYNEHSDIEDELLLKIENLGELKNKLKKINNNQALELLEKINAIDDPYKETEKIADYYLEYEVILRNDILSHLYVPTQNITVISDYRDTRPQLIHLFLRDSEKFRKELENRIRNKIIEERNDGNKSSELTAEEYERYNKLLNRLESEISKVQVNYSYESGVSVYTDSRGLERYASDTSNQISGSIYTEKYFYSFPNIPEMFGIGFNSTGLEPEAIAISSDNYLTTNRGLNNLEYDEKDEFNRMSACYSELCENDGKSEIVMFRRGLDFDTKAAYIFVAFNSEKANSIKNVGLELAKNSGMDIVLYDIVSIRNSYLNYLNENSNELDEVENIVEKHR